MKQGGGSGRYDEYCHKMKETRQLLCAAGFLAILFLARIGIFEYLKILRIGFFRRTSFHFDGRGDRIFLGRNRKQGVLSRDWLFLKGKSHDDPKKDFSGTLNRSVSRFSHLGPNDSVWLKSVWISVASS